MKTSKFFEFGFATKRDLQELSEAIKNAETIDGEVSTYANLPAPASHNGEIWLVKTTTGVVFANKKVAGLYVSNGTTWTIITPVEIDGYQKLITTPTDGNIVITDANGQTKDGGKKIVDLEQVINKDATSGYAGLTLFKINFKNVANTFTSFFTNSNTASRTYTFPDVDGTVITTGDTGSITSSMIANGTIATADIANSAITTAKLDSAGISATFVAGAVGEPSITTAGDTNTGIFFPAPDTIAFSKGGAEAMRIDPNGNLGIGTSSPTAGLHVNKVGIGGAIFAQHPGNATYGTIIQVATIAGPDAPVISMENYNGGSPVRYGISCTNNGSLAFISEAYIGGFGSERMRIDSSGRLTTPFQPAASVSYGGADVVPINVVPLNTSPDVRGGVTINNNRITVPVTGYYLIGYSHLAILIGTEVETRRNGVIIPGGRTRVQPNGAFGNFSCQYVQSLTAGDFIEFVVINGQLHGNNDYNRMYLALLG